MRSDISLVLNVLLLLLFTRDRSSAAPPVPPLSHADTSASPDHVTKDPGNQIPTWTRDPAVGGETTAETTSISATTGPATATNAAHPTHLWSTSVASAAATPARTDAAVVMTTDTGPASSAAAAHGLSSTPPPPPSSTPLHLDSTTESVTVPAPAPLTTTTTSPTPSMSSSARASTTTITTTFTTAQETQSESRTTGPPPTPAPSPVGPKHQEVPSELNAGDEDLMGPPFRPSSPLDPLLAGLLTVFIITTAIVFVVLFLKLRQRTAHPEFHRLQDLPMEDLMEDTPLSRYPY